MEVLKTVLEFLLIHLRSGVGSIPVCSSINQSMHMRVLSPMWEVALIQQEFLENNVFMITQFIIYKVK